MVVVEKKNLPHNAVENVLEKRVRFEKTFYTIYIQNASSSHLFDHFDLSKDGLYAIMTQRHMTF